MGTCHVRFIVEGSEQSKTSRDQHSRLLATGHISATNNSLLRITCVQRLTCIDATNFTAPKAKAKWKLCYNHKKHVEITQWSATSCVKHWTRDALHKIIPNSRTGTRHPRLQETCNMSYSNAHAMRLDNGVLVSWTSSSPQAQGS